MRFLEAAAEEEREWTFPRKLREEALVCLFSLVFLFFPLSGGAPRLRWGRVPVRTCPQPVNSSGGVEPEETHLTCLLWLYAPPPSLSLSLSESGGITDLNTEMSANDRATRALREILQNPGNEVCADCGAPGKKQKTKTSASISGEM